jgi:hypothetical protein
MMVLAAIISVSEALAMPDKEDLPHVLRALSNSSPNFRLCVSSLDLARFVSDDEHSQAHRTVICQEIMRDHSISIACEELQQLGNLKRISTRIR